MRFDRWTKARTLTFGPWKAQRASRELVSPAGTQVLEPEAMELLFLLAANGGEMVGREEISKKLWPRGAMPADALTRCVSQLRQALGDDPHAPKYIHTSPKRGDGPGPVNPDGVVLNLPVRPWLIAWMVMGSAVILAAFLWFLERT